MTSEYGPVGPEGEFDQRDDADYETRKLLERQGYEYLRGQGDKAVYIQRVPRLDSKKMPVIEDGKPVIDVFYVGAGDLLDEIYGKDFNPLRKDKSAPAKGSLEYDAQGRAYRGGVADPRFDNYTRAAGYRAPSTAAPRAPTPPQTFTDRNGDVVGIDPFTGAEVYRIAGAQWADISPEEKERIRQGDLNMARLFQRERDTTQNQFTRDENALGRSASAAENALSRAASSAENNLSRQFQSGESALSRAFSGEEGYQSRVQRAGEFLANYELSRAQESRAAQEAKLRAAQTFTSLSASPDLTGYQRFLAAGGGSAANALASGATSLTREGQLGAARALQTAEAPIVVPAPYSYTPERNQFVNGTPGMVAPAQYATTGNGAAAGIAAANAWNASNPNTGGTTLTLGSSEGSVAPAPPPAPTFGPAPPPGVAGAWGYANGTDGEPIFRDASQFAPMGPAGAAQGEFISGDAEDPMNPAAGGAQPELVQLEDPPGPDNAQARITPLTPPGGGEPQRMGALFHAIGDFLDGGGESEFAPPMGEMPPRFAYGGEIGMNGMTAITPQDDPYIDRVLAMRKQTPYTLNPFAADYFNSSPTTRSINEAGAQVASGAPIGEFQWEAQRYQPGMLSRDSLNLGR